MEFSEFNKVANHPELLTGIPKLPDKFLLRAEIKCESQQPNLLSKGAISSQFGRVSLPSDFGDLMVDEQIAIAEKLAKSHYEKFVERIPSQGRIAYYVLFKNDATLKNFDLVELT